MILEDENMLVIDREDLIAILRMRFGEVSPHMITAIYEIDQLDTLERLILVAANAPEWKIFIEEFNEAEASFRIAGERFNPMGQHTEKG